MRAGESCMKSEERTDLPMDRFCDWVLLGQGAFGKVYRVREKNNGKLWACKVLEDVHMAERERDFLIQMKHPLFPEYREFFVFEKKCFLVMEYICGENLKQFIKRRGCVKQERAVRIVTELAEGLLFLHERNVPILFRDIKPENVILRQDGKVRLVDAGCAGYLAGQGIVGGSTALSRAGSVGYAAPEQLNAFLAPGIESDVYALGQLLHFLTGTRNTSKGFRKLVREALEADRKKRIPDMYIFMKRLKEYDDCVYERRVDRYRRKFLGKVSGRGTAGKKQGFYYEKNVSKNCR